MLAGQLCAAEPLNWAFIGVWDRSMPQVEAACRENGIHVEFFKGQKFNETQQPDQAARFRLVFVLNLEADQASALTQRLKQAREINPEQRVIPLDARGSQMDLEKAGLLLKDEAVPAYWRPNGTVNVRRLIRYCMVKHCGAAGEIEAPVLIPEAGYYDSAREDAFSDINEFIIFKRGKQRWVEGASVAVLLLQQSFWITHDLKVIDAQIIALEKQGLNVVPVFGDREEQVTKLTRAAAPNMSFVYTQDTWGEKVDGLYEEALQNTDTVLRVWASNMTSQLSNHHAYEYLGGLSMAVKKVTGKSPAALISDVRDPGGARVRDFEEVLASNLKSELLNRRWLEGMKSHDYAGAGHIAELVKNTFGWSVTRRESITQETWDEVYEVLVKDKHKLQLAEWFERVSPHAMQEISATLIEAARKDLWQATPEQLQTLTKLYASSVKAHGDSGGLVSGGNTRMADFVSAKLTAPGDQESATLAQDMKAKLQQSAAAPDTVVEKVSGPQISEAKEQAPNASKPQQQGTVLEPAWNAFAWLIAAAAVLLVIVGFFKRAGSTS